MSTDIPTHRVERECYAALCARDPSLRGDLHPTQGTAAAALRCSQTPTEQLAAVEVMMGLSGIAGSSQP